MAPIVSPGKWSQSHVEFVVKERFVGRKFWLKLYKPRVSYTEKKKEKKKKKEVNKLIHFEFILNVTLCFQA